MLCAYYDDEGNISGRHEDARRNFFDEPLFVQNEFLTKNLNGL